MLLLMKTFDKKSLIKFSPLLLISVFFIVLAFVNPPLFKNENGQKISTSKISASQSAGQNVSTSPANNSADIKINDNVKGAGNQSGTCTVTKNGVTTTVPVGSVNVNEKSSGDINVKVDCKSQTNSSNQTSINNNVDVKVNSGN